MSSKTFKIAMPEGLDTHDTSPPPLPSWLKGFCVTSKAPSDVRRAGLEVCKLLADGFFKLSYDDVSVPRSMVKPGETEVPYDTAEAILVPGSPGTIFVALRPDGGSGGGARDPRRRPTRSPRRPARDSHLRFARAR